MQTETTKKVWDMTADELAEATAELDGDMPAPRRGSLSEKGRLLHELASTPPRGETEDPSGTTVKVVVPGPLLRRIDTYAAELHLTRSELIAHLVQEGLSAAK